MQDLRKAARIYTKDPVDGYRKRINEEAEKIVLRCPSLVLKRGELLEKAQLAVAESGYAYKKGHSRSKRLQSSPATKPKRAKFSQEMRESRIKGLSEEIAQIKDTIRFKDLRLKQAEEVKNYRLCDQISEELLQLKRDRSHLEAELHVWEKKEKRSKSYFRRLSSDTSEDSDFPLSSLSSATCIYPPSLSSPSYPPSLSSSSCDRPRRLDGGKN